MRILIYLFLGVFCLTFPASSLEIQYLGHSGFFLRFAGGLRVILDPFSSSLGYPPPQEEADLLLSSHEHPDHYNPDFLGKEVVTLAGTTNNGAEWNLFVETLGEVRFFNLPSYHDDQGGKLRGKNTLLVLEGEGMRIVHLGDLGTRLTLEEVKNLGVVSILFLPVGGYYTITPEEAQAMVAQLKPAVVIPMHYRTEVTATWPIAPIEEFLSLVQGFPIHKKGHGIMITKDTLPQQTEIWILEYPKRE